MVRRVSGSNQQPHASVRATTEKKPDIQVKVNNAKQEVLCASKDPVKLRALKKKVTEEHGMFMGDKSFSDQVWTFRFALIK